MKKHFFLLLFHLLLVQVCAQTYKTEFAYDYAGNRISRKVIILSMSADPAAAPRSETSLQEEMSECRITVYPNPTKGRLAVAFSGSADETVHKMYLYTSSGQVLFREALNGNGEVTFDLSAYSSGIYILSVRTGEEESQYKIVKQ